MILPEIILIVMGLLTVAVIAALICRNTPIPYTALLVMLGVLLGWLARTYPQFALLLHFQLTPGLVFFFFLPALIFESAFNLDARQLIKDIAPILTLAIPALLVSTAIIAAGLWQFLGMQLVLALLFGALISATDPVAVIALFKELGAPQRLTVLVEGESLLNDATAIVLFNIVLGLAMSNSLDIADAGAAVVEFLRVFCGGLLAGAIIGILLGEVLHLMRADLNLYLVMSIVLAYASFVVAEHLLHVSGVMAVVAGTISLNVFGISRTSQETTTVIRETWEMIALICNSLLFLLVGLSVDIVGLLQRIDMILIAILLVLLARAATVYTMVPVTVRLFKLSRISIGERHIMWWGALKGGLAIAIALSIPEDMPGRMLLLDVTLGVVLFSLLVNASTIRALISILGIDRLTDDERTELRYGLIRARRYAGSIVQRFHQTELVSRSTQQLIQNRLAAALPSKQGDAKKEQDLRHLFIHALRIEFEELKYLYDIGLLQHYTYLNIKNDLQRDRESWLANPGACCYQMAATSASIFARIEHALLKRMREHDWVAGLLSRYQYLRLAQSLQRDIAGMLICERVLAELAKNDQYTAVQKERVATVYRERLKLRKARLHKIISEFPDFYLRFETHLFTRAAFIGADFYIRQIRHHQALSAKVYLQIAQRIRKAFSSLASISNPAPRLTSSDLLRAVPLLDGLPDKLLARISKLAYTITLLGGDVIIGEREKGDALYIIVHGLVCVFKGKGGHRVAELRDGDFFGEMALLGAPVRTATVKAQSTTTLLRISRKDIITLSDAEPELKARLEEVRAQRQIGRQQTLAKMMETVSEQGLDQQES